MYGQDFPLFTELLPAYESPVRSPMSAVQEAADEQYASLRDRSPSPRQQRQASPRAPTPRQPSPVRDPYTDSFGLPIVHTHDSPLKERSPSPSSPKARSPPAAQQSPVAGPSTAARSPAAGPSPGARSPAAGSPKSKSPAAGPPSPAKSPKTEADIKELAENQYKTLMESPKPEKPAPLSQEEVEAFEDSQYATLYESLIAEPEAPGTPGGRSPRHAHPADLMGVEAPVHYQSPQQPHFFDGEIPGNLPSPIGAHHQLGGWQTPPNMRLQPRRTASPILPPMVAYFGQDLLGQEQFPADEEPPRSPEPPPPSPPTPPARFAYEEMADPFQLDADFNEPVDDIMDEEMAALGGMVAAHEIHPFQPGRRGISRRRGTPMPRQEPIDEEPEYLMLPSPERASPHRSFSEYDYLLSPDQTQPQQPQQQQQQQSPGQVAGPSMRSQAEELFIQNFDNPDHQAMMRRVMALVEDVENEALITEEDVEILKAAHPLSAIESTDAAGMMAVSPPREQRELLELNDMEGPMSPLQQDMEIPEFNYQQSDFMAPVPQYQLPYELPQSRHVFTEPGEMEEPEQPFQEILAFEEAQGQPPMQIQDMAVAPSPSPIRRRIPTPGTYVSPPGNMVDFFMENLNRQPAPYREGPTTVFTGGRQQMVHRDASRRVPRMRRIRELPNMDEEGVNFMEHVERASQWYGKGSTQAGVMPIDVTRNRERMQQRRATRNVLSNTNLRTVTETQEVSEPLISPLQPRGQARIKKRTVRKRINFDQDNPSGSPEPQKQVSPIHEPLPLLPDRPLPPPRAPPPQMSTSPRAGPSGAPQPSRRVLFGTPPRPEGDRPKPRRITLFGSPLPEGEEASPTTASSMLTMMRHADLLRQPSPQQGDDMMGAYGAVQEASARHILDDDDIPQQLPSPMRAPIEIPGWQTPSPAPRAASPRLPPAAGPCGQANLMIEQPPLLDDDGMLMSPTQSPMLATQRQSFMPSPGRAQAPWPGGMRTVTSTTTTKTPEMTKTTKTTRTTPSSPQPPPQFSPSPQQQQQMMARQMSPAMEQQQQQPSPQSYQMAPPMTPRTPAHVSPRPSPYWTGGTPMQTPPFQMIQQQQTQQRAMSSPASPGAWARTINDMSTLQDDFDIGMSPHLVESPQQRPPEEEWADIMALPRDEAQVQARYGHLTTADDYVMPEARRRTPRQGTLLERVEQLVADVPSPEMQYSNQASPVNTVQYSPYQSPHWTPTLPQARAAAAATGFDGLSPMRPQAAGITNLEVISPVLAMSPRSPTASPSPRQSPCPQSPCGMSPVFATSPQTLGVVPFLGEEAEPYDLPSSPQMSPPPRAIQEDIQYSPPAFQSPPRSRTPSPRVPTPRAPTPRMPTPPMAQSPCRPATPGSPPMTMTAASPRRSPVVGNLVAMSPQQQNQNQPYMVETTETVEEYGPENIMDQFMTNAEMMQQPSALTERQLDWQSPPPPARVAPASPYRPELHLPAARRTLDMMAAVPNDMMFMNESLEDPLQSPRTPTQGIFEQAGADGGGPGLFDYDYPDMYDDPLSPMYQDGSGCGGGACPSSSSQYYDQGMDMNEDEQMLQQRMSPMAGPSHQPHSVTPGASETTMNEEIVYGASGQPHTITKETTTVSPDGQVQEEYEYTEMMDDGQGQNQQQQGDDDGYGYAD
ncbi:PREDICTED: nascent polypeptide-associated complex subunit alpha, muscle-specific form [Nicrophorus vespilloides]|uniref:Nascent polypeptide-associated complex subunit alpha, muscle-specific form n=1 Tax=Nicrophorus vespilloides TaxID=110193 RepID=A0ABM1MNE9_NICVS|nr:PREDICTED: nascent polypeptide-associated complex subunit alpha, muscle-specific form [Nicrophorus vespilloides]